MTTKKRTQNLVALACAANVSPGHAMMNRSPSGDIDILVLFVAHNFDGVKVLIDNRTGKTRKIIDVTSSTLDIQKKYLSSVCMLSPVMRTSSASSGKGSSNLESNVG